MLQDAETVDLVVARRDGTVSCPCGKSARVTALPAIELALAEHGIDFEICHMQEIRAG